MDFSKENKVILKENHSIFGVFVYTRGSNILYRDEKNLSGI